MFQTIILPAYLDYLLHTQKSDVSKEGRKLLRISDFLIIVKGPELQIPAPSVILSSVPLLSGTGP